MTRCDDCNGKGWFKTGIGVVYFGAIKYLPTYRTCTTCKGKGELGDSELEDMQEREWKQMYKLHGLNRSINNRI